MGRHTKRPALFAAPNYQQAELLPAPAPIERSQEPPAMYEAALKLRRAGYTVQRVGRLQHRVGKRLVTTRELLELARYAN